MKRIYYLIALAVILFSVVIGSLSLGSPAEVTAAPQAAPTPITVSRNEGQPQFIEWARFQRIRADTRYCLETWGFESLEVQTRLEMNSGVNTTTMKVQVTNDKLYYSDGPTLLNAVVTHTTNHTPIPAQFRYTCFNVDMSNTNTETLWINAVGK